MSIERARSNSIDSGEISAIYAKTPEPERVISTNFLKSFVIRYRPKYTPILNKLHIPDIKRLNTPLIEAGYKFLKFTLKSELIDHRVMTLSARKIQRFIRSKIMTDPVCPITMTNLVYPYFTFKPPEGPLIYYDLESLANFLVCSGEFRDPKTRIKYNIDIIKKIDQMMKSSRKKIAPIDGKQFINVEKAMNDKEFYRKKKEKENEFLVIDRELDIVTSKLLKYIENDNTTEIFEQKIIPYIHYFRKIKELSKSYAETCFNRILFNILDLRKRGLYKNIILLKKVFRHVYFESSDIFPSINVCNAIIEFSILE